LDSHGQQFSNKDLEELAKEQSQQEEEEEEEEVEENEKDEEPPLNHMKTSDIQNILSDMETLIDELCDNDHDWKQSAKVKRTVIVSTGPYFEVLKERKRKSQQSTLHALFKEGKILNQGPYCGTYKNFLSGLPTYQNLQNIQNSVFLFHEMQLLYITFN
jgi:hypothetical protein